MTQRRAFPAKQVTVTNARMQLAQLLCGATDDKLRGFTVDGLARMYRVQPKDIGQMLALERRRRGLGG